MRTRLALVLAVLALAGFSALARAEEAKEVTLQGDLTCGKCTLKQGDKCNDVLVVKEGDAEVQYAVVFTEATKGNHMCNGKKAVKVTGTVAVVDGKKTITATKIEKVG